MSMSGLFGRDRFFLGWWGVGGVVAVIAYNVWAYCCGRCALIHFMQINGVIWLLVAGNLVAGLILVMLKLGKHRDIEPLQCSCGNIVDDKWLFCPECGRKR